MVLVFILYINSYTQVIEGIIKEENNHPIPNAEIVLNIESKKILSDSNGRFKIEIDQNSVNDTINICVKAQGYESTCVNNIGKEGYINVNMLRNVGVIDEIILNKYTKRAGKTIYKINQKDYINGVKADKVIQRIPNIYLGDGKLMLFNRKNINLFIDGLEVELEELKKINARDIERVEVVNNVSAEYNSIKGLDAIIYIVTRKKIENNIYGEFELTKGYRLNRNGISPSISYKTEKVNVRAMYSLSNNIQIIKDSVDRKYNNIFIRQGLERYVEGKQNNFNIRAKVNIDDKSFLYIGGNYFGYNFIGNTSGIYEKNSKKNIFFSNDKEKLVKWNIYSTYEYLINKNKSLYIKSKNYNYSNYNHYNTLDIEKITESKITEFSNEITFINKKGLNYTLGYQNIIRNFEANHTLFKVNQYINTLYGNMSHNFSNRFSSFVSLAYELTSNKGRDVKQNYSNLLSSVSLRYERSNKLDFEINYSNKIIRPGIDFLNPSMLIYNPMKIIKGNDKLLPEKIYYIEAIINRKINKNNNISINLYSENTINAIVQTVDNTYVSSYHNIGKTFKYGIYTGINSKIKDNISINGGVGVDYNKYISNFYETPNSEGISFNSNLNITATIGNNYIITINGNYKNKIIRLVDKTYNNPYISVEFEKSFFRDRLNVNLSYSDIFSWSRKSIVILNSNSFYQKNITDNNLSNILLTLVFKIGKTFSNRIKSPTINNNDIIYK